MAAWFFSADSPFDRAGDFQFGQFRFYNTQRYSLLVSRRRAEQVEVGAKIVF